MKKLTLLILVLVFMLSFTASSRAQLACTVFTYQGQLTDDGNPANGRYDFEFRLFDDPDTGSQVGNTIILEDEVVRGGYFNVMLDFGVDDPSIFNGDDRWLRIGVRPWNSTDDFTILSPRQQITPVPYAFYAGKAGSVTGGDPNYISKFLTDNKLGNSIIYESQNKVGIGTTNPGSRLDIEGAVNTSSFYQIGGQSVLSVAGNYNTMIGTGAGSNNTGSYATLVGYRAGTNNTANANTFVGYQAGHLTTSGQFNTFMGTDADSENTIGHDNVFIGSAAGAANTEGYNNTFIGMMAGSSNTSGYRNTFLGYYAGQSNTSGLGNTFLGRESGWTNTTGEGNVFIGDQTGYSNTIGILNTFVGNYSGYDNSEGTANVFLGLLAGRSNTTGNNNTFLGVHAGHDNTIGSGNVFLGNQAGYSETGSDKLYIANSSSNPPLIYGDFDTGEVGIGTTSPDEKLHVNGNVKIVDGNQGEGRVLTSDPNGVASWQTPASSGLPSGVIVMWSGSIASIPTDWALCDGTNGTPDLTSKFIRSVTNASTDPGSTGGSATHAHSAGSYSASSHTHTYSGSTSTYNWNVRREGDQWDSGSTGTHSHTYSGTTSSSVGGAISGISDSANSLPPYYALAFIMKI